MRPLGLIFQFTPSLHIYRVNIVKCKKVLSFYSLMLHLHDLESVFSFITMLDVFFIKISWVWDSGCHNFFCFLRAKFLQFYLPTENAYDDRRWYLLRPFIWIVKKPRVVLDAPRLVIEGMRWWEEQQPQKDQWPMLVLVRSYGIARIVLPLFKHKSWGSNISLKTHIWASRFGF